MESFSPTAGRLQAEASDSVNFIGCDWGSTSFRLRVIERTTRRVLAEQRAAEGVKTYAALPPIERAAAMEAFLTRRLAAWPQIAATTPLVISGMASSSVGWTDVAYTRVPFPLDGSECRFARLTLASAEGKRREVILLSGLRADDDIMRGEECALMGAYALRPDCLHSKRETLALLAGTHSKHVRIVDGAVQGFRTHITGELLDALSSRSLLAASIERAAESAKPDLPSFCAGVACTRERGVSAALFQVRVRDVLHGCGKKANSWFLSGVLVGAELARFTLEPARGQLLLIGVPLRIRLYREALRTLGIVGEEVDLPTIDLDEAVVAGQEALLTHVANAVAP